jgi:hypothetical protein
MRHGQPLPPGSFCARKPFPNLSSVAVLLIPPSRRALRDEQITALIEVERAR